MRVIVYVEGPSDQKAMQALLKPIIETGRANKVGLSFLPLGGKGPILNDVPRKAARHLRQNPDDWVFAVPDLYPMVAEEKSLHRHRSFTELAALLQKRFAAHAEELAVPETARGHFRVHCFKHDLEALVLAAPEQLKQRLKTTDALRGRWRLPVEEQNDEQPPKYVVVELFRHYRKKTDYNDTTDAPWILERASLAEIERACAHNFGPFVGELRALSENREPREAAAPTLVSADGEKAVAAPKAGRKGGRSDNR